MGHTTGRRHLRRIAAPKTWPIPRKGSYWIVKPSPGPHKMELSMPILLWIRDYLKYVKNLREARYILNNKRVYVDGRPITNYKFPVGIFDVLSFPDLNEHYRVLINNKGKLYLKRIDEKEAKYKIVRVIRKQSVNGGKIQVTGHDGRNFLFNDPKDIKIGDSLLIELPKQKIVKKIPMEANTIVFFYYGAKVGTLGKVKEIKIFRKSFGHKRFIIYEDLDTKEIKETIWEYAIPVGKEKIEITVR